MTVPHGAARITVSHAASPDAIPYVLGTVNTVIQSIWYCNNTDTLWTAQGRDADLDTNGDLRVTQYLRSGSSAWFAIGYMNLFTFGHGVSFSSAYNSSTDQTHLWIECCSSTAGRGKQICYFVWDPITSGDPTSGPGTAQANTADLTVTTNLGPALVMTNLPITDPHDMSVCVQSSTLVMTVRFSDGATGPFFQAWPLRDAQENIYTSAYCDRIPQPDFSYPDNPETDFQGWTFMGAYLYFWTSNSDSSNTQLSSIDMNGNPDGDPPYDYKAALQKIDPTIIPREAEGVTYVVGYPGLIFGLRHTVDGDRRLNLYNIE